MPDNSLRNLERAWIESNSHEDEVAYNIARLRAGLGFHPEKQVLCLGYRSSTNDMVKSLDEKFKDLNVKVVGGWTKIWTLDYLMEVGTPLKNSFRISLGYDSRTQYQIANKFEAPIDLFICSTLLRESSSDRASRLNDGEHFALNVLPHNPKIILHVPYPGFESEVPLVRVKADSEDKIYHINYDMKSRELLCDLAYLVLLHKGRVPFDEYEDTMKRSLEIT